MPQTTVGWFCRDYLEGYTFEQVILLQKVQKGVQVEIELVIV
jgi:hypothetical protein